FHDSLGKRLRKILDFTLDKSNFLNSCLLSIRLKFKHHIARNAALLSPPLPVPSPPLPLPSPLTTSPTDTGAPLGYRAARIRMIALHLSTSLRTDIPEADVPPKRGLALLLLLPDSRSRRVSQLRLQGSQGLQSLTLGDTGLSRQVMGLPTHGMR
nr:hypothetical protein [Tanacetum cinerariifolium]